MPIILRKTCLAGMAAALLLPLALTACGGADAALTDKVAAAEAAAKRAEDAATRAENAARAASAGGNGNVYANDPAPVDVQPSPSPPDVQQPAQANPDAGADVSAGAPVNPA